MMCEKQCSTGDCLRLEIGTQIFHCHATVAFLNFLNVHIISSRQSNCSDLILLAEVADYNMFLLSLVHIRVSDIICITYVWMLFYSSFSLKALSLLCSDLVKSAISYVSATVM